MTQKHPLTHQEFWDIYKKVPRLTVEIILRNEQGTLLTMRDIEPCKGLWHIPGGTVEFGERLTEAVARIAKRKLGITVTDTKLLGYIEYPSHYQNGLDSPVGIAFQIVSYTGDVDTYEEARNYRWFTELPAEQMHAEQVEFLREHA
jgi:ADP-ribose pyrophosphatase YjhB (NUDIX family)